MLPSADEKFDDAKRNTCVRVRANFHHGNDDDNINDNHLANEDVDVNVILNIFAKWGLKPCVALGRNLFPLACPDEAGIAMPLPELLGPGVLRFPEIHVQTIVL